jgi:hypothetical protein
MADPTNPYAQYAEQENPYAQLVGEPKDKPKPIKIGREGLADQLVETARYTHPIGQGLAGIGFGLDDLSTRAGQLWAYANRGGPNVPAPELTPEQQSTLQEHRALYQDSPMAMTGNIGTGAALTAPLAGPVFNAAKAGGEAVLPWFAKFLAPTAGAGVVGGATATTQPTLPGESTAQNMQHGGVAGVIADTVLRGGARAIQPITQSPAVQRLLNQDIVPTIGQAVGGMANRMEEKVMSWPFVGDIISGARNRARNELGEAGINLQMPKDLKVTQPGNAGIEQAKTNLSQGYNDLYGNTSVGRDPKLLQDLDAAANKPVIPLSEDYKKNFDRIIKREVLDRLPAGATFPTGEVKKQIEASLGEQIRGLGPMPSGQDLALKQALEEARGAVRNLANRGAGIDQSRRAALDRGYANMKDMETAATRSESNGGVPTPLQIIQAAKEKSKLEGLGRDAQEVLGNRVPNSGTTDRALMAMMLGGLGAGASQNEHYQSTPFLNELGPAFWLSLGISPLAYSRAGSRYAVGDLIPGQPALSQAMRQLSPYAASAGALYPNQ